jgi:PPOX class probable F420-dependent enzyme
VRTIAGVSGEPTIDELARASYLRLTTFRRDGTPVPTPVWVARDGDRLAVVTTPATGKAKRLRHTPRVLIAVCDRRGRVAPGTPEVEAAATLVDDPAAIERLAGLLVRKYGVVARAAQFLWRVRGTETVRIEIALPGATP